MNEVEKAGGGKVSSGGGRVLALIEKFILPKALTGKGGVKTPYRDPCDTKQNTNSPDSIPVCFAFWGSKVLFSAVEMGVFTELASSPRVASWTITPMLA